MAIKFTLFVRGIKGVIMNLEKESKILTVYLSFNKQWSAFESVQSVVELNVNEKDKVMLISFLADCHKEECLGLCELRRLMDNIYFRFVAVRREWYALAFMIKIFFFLICF